jgi:hypothetical protein
MKCGSRVIQREPLLISPTAKPVMAGVIVAEKQKKWIFGYMLTNNAK